MNQVASIIEKHIYSTQSLCQQWKHLNVLGNRGIISALFCLAVSVQGVKIFAIFC